MAEAETNQSHESEGGNMQKIKCKPPPVIKESEFRYQCEWDTCEQIETDMSAFIKHVGTHVVKYHQQTLHADLGTGICYTCGWRACGTQIIGSEIDFNRHIYFHVFHVRIKYVGTHLSNTLHLNTCQIGTQSRNWIPELPENLECSWRDCGIIYDNPYLFYCHVSLHAQVYSEGRDVSCKCLWADCDAVVRSRHRLKEHLRSHTQEKVIACPTCGSLFCSRTKLVDHFLRQTHSDLQRYECSHCNRRYTTEKLLRDHMRRHVDHYKCPVCDMTCPTPAALRQHARYKHTEVKPFKCGHCEHSAKSASDLRKHLESHNVEDQYRCHIQDCTFSTRSYGSLSFHFKRAHQGTEGNPRYMCHVCSKTFVRGGLLSMHLKKKHFFQRPPGHSRFRYKLHEDGFLRLLTIRYESIDITDYTADDDNGDTSASSSSTASEQQTTNSSSIIINNNNIVPNVISAADGSQVTILAPVAAPLPTWVASTVGEIQQNSAASQVADISVEVAGDEEGGAMATGRKRARSRSTARKKTSGKEQPVFQPPRPVATSGEARTRPKRRKTVQKVSCEAPQTAVALQHNNHVEAAAATAAAFSDDVDKGGNSLLEGPGDLTSSEYRDFADANLHMLGDVALNPPKELNSVVSLALL